MNAAVYHPRHKVRVVTAAALFDGHDASINIMRRILQDSGAEVVHLGHNRSVADIAKAAIEEDANGVAISSYQGGHNEFFRYLADLLRQGGGGHIRIFGGGGGVIIPSEIRALHDYGIARIYSPEDGRRLGLQGMINDILASIDVDLTEGEPGARGSLEAVRAGDRVALARAISILERSVDDPGRLPEDIRALLTAPGSEGQAPAIGITGTGGAGKSSFTDELVRRLHEDQPGLRVAVLSVDPTRRRTGGALLGDRIRMNALQGDAVFMRSLATRESGSEISSALAGAIRLCRAAGYGAIFVETSGIGQGNSAVMEVADIGVYVMTPEYGAPSQLEKIDMLDYADLVVINKFDRRGAEDALRDVRKQVRRNAHLFQAPDEALPVYGTISSQFADPGVNAAYRDLLTLLAKRTGRPWSTRLPDPGGRVTPPRQRVLPANRARYLGEIADTVRGYHRWVDEEARTARRWHALTIAARELAAPEHEGARAHLEHKAEGLSEQLAPQTRRALDGWDELVARYHQRELVYGVRGQEIRQPLVFQTLSGLSLPRVAVPRTADLGERVRWSLLENVPGEFPYTAGVFPLKRRSEEPKRMFAGEGGPARTNARFHFLTKGEPAHRLSTAFDSVTLYGEDPDERPDIYGKIGESGVSIATLDDMRVLYGGFDLCAPSTSVSMTINGPAPMLLAMFFNTAIEQQRDRFRADHGRDPSEDEDRKLVARTQSVVRGTVQADILKEDQAQNTCIFSVDFALRMMGDIQRFFVDNNVRNYYSVSISGYHIAEAGANPISQLAFTLANGFTFVEYYRARGMDIDAFAPNLSFFFSNGMDAEYTVIGRVARRIWAVAMARLYGGSARSQMLKYHIQTSGRSLHAREIQFNDIRTTLQALLALYDQCNSLHTNAYDEAITTPTEESVRRAMAIQKILNQEFGLLQCENALQGSYIVDELTDLVEEAVLKEFERLNDRGGVLGAMETQYQRSKIQEESLHYERLKHSGELPIVGINTFVDPATQGEDWEPPTIELRRSTPAEKDDQIARLRAFQARNASAAPAALARLKEVALSGGNTFAELLATTRVASLGQITRALYEVGGAYRRNA